MNSTLSNSFAMKYLLAFVIAALMCDGFRLHANPLSRVLVQKALEISGTKVLSRTARELAERSATRAIQKLGKEGAERAVERGGLAILNAGARHGDDVWNLVKRCPEGVKYVAAKPQEAISMARKFGNDILIIESRTPGLGVRAAELLGPSRLPALARAKPEEVARLVGYASKADSPATRNQLFDLWMRRGGEVLDRLDKHKGLILAGGLTVATLKLADSMGESMETMSAKVDAEDVGFAIRRISSSFAAAILLITAAGLAYVGFFIHRRFGPASQPRSQPQPRTWDRNGSSLAATKESEQRSRDQRLEF